MELKGLKRVEIADMKDKWQITVVVCGTRTGELIPFEVMYQGKTSATIPHVNFPKDGHLTYTANHWCNEERMIDLIVFPYAFLLILQMIHMKDYLQQLLFDNLWSYRV